MNYFKDDKLNKYKIGLKSPKMVAVLVALIIFIWMFSGIFITHEVAEKNQFKQSKVVPNVAVKELIAEDKVYRVVLNGVTESPRNVIIKPETSGVIEKIVATEGGFINKGEVIVVIEQKDRKARVEQAKSLVKQRELEYKVSKSLSKSGHESETKLAAAYAALKSAEADLIMAKWELDSTKIKAPFSGILEKIYIEEGDAVKNLETNVASLIDTDPFLVVVDAPESIVNKVTSGSAASVKIINGQEKPGIIKYVSSVANNETRTFRVEIEIDNKDGRVVSGLTAKAILPLEKVKAYYIETSNLALDESGEIGVKILNEENKVSFKKGNIVQHDANGMWISGLPEAIRLITLGQAFVMPGDKIEIRKNE